MPKIYQHLGFIYFFYSNEHLPIHCHVKKGRKEVKVIMEYDEGKLSIRFVKVRRKKVFDGKDLNTIETFIKAHHIKIVQKWTDFFVYGKYPNFEQVKGK